jgi:hypothetical protein
VERCALHLSLVSDLIIALKILSGMEQENIQIQINERIELENLILILNSF